MRPLKRPMFRTGGPIKEGVMNGLRDGGVATTMADATMMAGGGMPNMRGRVTGPGGYAGLKDKAIKGAKIAGGTIGSGVGLDLLFNIINNASAAGLFAKGGLADLPPMRGMVTGPGKYSQDKSLIDTAGNILKKSVGQTATNLKKNPVKTAVTGRFGKAAKYGGGILDNLLRRFNIQTFPKRIPSSGGMGGVKLTPGQIQAGMGTQPLSFLQRVNMFRKANPKTFYGSLGVGTTSGAIPIGGAKLAELGGNLGLEVADRLVYDKFFDQDKVIGGNVREVFGKVKKALGFEEDKDDKDDKDDKGRDLTIQQKGGTGLTQAEIDAKKKLNEEQRLNKIYKLLGVDRAKRNAASKALIDMSRYIDEGGKDVISKQNIGSTISKAIGAFDKRLDKVDQLKEAAGLMQAKGIIEKDIRSSDNELKELQKQKIRKDLQKNFSDLKLVSKIPGQKGVNIAAASSSDNYRGNLITQSDLSETIEKVKKNEGILDETVIIENITNETIKDKNIADGDYTVGDALVTIEQGKVTSVLR
jgi:hypothetical protein